MCAFGSIYSSVFREEAKLCVSAKTPSETYRFCQKRGVKRFVFGDYAEFAKIR